MIVLPFDAPPPHGASTALFLPPRLTIQSLFAVSSCHRESLPMSTVLRFVLLLGLFSAASPLFAQTAGVSGADDLVIVNQGKSDATIIVSAKAGKWEKQAADDL